MTEPEQIGLFQEDDLPLDQYTPTVSPTSGKPLQLTELRIEALKGFNEVIVELRPLTILTGPNNSGKSTVLQAVALAFECMRRCVDTKRWRLLDTGRAVTEFDFLPVNELRDLWYNKVWKPSKEKERYVKVGLKFSNGFSITFRIRFLFGLLNIGLDEKSSEVNPELLQSLMSAIPVLIPSTMGPSAHEEFRTLASVYRLVSIREPSRVVRNILVRLQEEGMQEARAFLDEVLARYFKASLETIVVDEARDVEIRAPLKEGGYSLDIVSSGSGVNQILQLAAVIAWRKPSIVLLDEPDAHLHTSVQAQLFDFINRLVEDYGMQVILATHSRDLISQAPLESIVPVDRSRARLSPLASLEHLLLEYQRYGTVSNIDLALLYQTKRCLFVEGPTDVRLLPRIAERCGITIFSGPRQAVPFAFGGIDKIKYLPEMISLFEKLVGSKLTWGVVRDGDASVPAVKIKQDEEAARLNIPFFHRWERYSLENYLLEPNLLLATIRAKKPDIDISEDDVLRFLAKAVEKTTEDADAAFVTRAQLAYRDLKLADNPHDAGAKAATKFIKEIDTLEKKIALYPGKRIFGAFVQEIQEELGINIRVDDVVAILTPENMPREIAEALSNFDKILERALPASN